MAQIGQYIVSVCSAAMICAIINALLENSKTIASIGKILTGIFLTLTIIRPLMDIKIGNLLSYVQDISMNAESYTQQGIQFTHVAEAEVIKGATEAYILDKADSLDAVLDVNVVLSEESPYVPCSVRISGTIAPYAKEELQRFISQELGISEEEQIWIA